ncbi:MAG: nucleotide exchange factor GrpE [Candidatus Colwellbacteria bacterium CG10_big_fil_rev_8_21_14_0_10_42_22]|uniref:Protein GrpE n=1 Tax=Candidatus Colwellbacteria bacterium CG10_big_fil_rev_8_21_14_0_10_42_22 TaxID=1974540 RepID=A0A2H0VF19_9BACT|nr:MAG: nucleotide exchange factor GrpE [Candidatus Colwellbacteria bacterium CG10_big_fil_rev_8_21_14_0_10_42_22]
MTQKDYKNHSAHPGQEDKKIEKVKDLQRQCDEYLAGWQRAKADLSNYKKDEFKRLEEVAKFANTEILMDLIRVVDSFELGILALEKASPVRSDSTESKQVEKGIHLIKSQLENVMKKYGLERIEAKEGDNFDPAFHEAITSVEGNDKNDGKIAEEVETGYALNERVLRASKVKVYKSKK